MSFEQLEPRAVLFFGQRWDAPAVDDAIQVPTPVGELCGFCREPVVAGERGLFRQFVTEPRPDELGALLEPIEGGIRIKRAGGHYIDVLRMIFNWRIATTPVDDPLTIDRHWCYAGTDVMAFLTTAISAARWDGAADTEPGSWNKNGQTGQWREPGSSGTWERG